MNRPPGISDVKLREMLFNLPKDSEIIVPSNTYIATILPIVEEGLTPVLVEPDIQTYNINPKKIEDKITSNTKAIMITHLYGKPCEMEPILEIQNIGNAKGFPIMKQLY